MQLLIEPDRRTALQGAEGHHGLQPDGNPKPKGPQASATRTRRKRIPSDRIGPSKGGEASILRKGGGSLGAGRDARPPDERRDVRLPRREATTRERSPTTESTGRPAALRPRADAVRVRGRVARDSAFADASSTTLVSDGTPGEFSRKHGDRRHNPGPLRFNPTPRQTPPVRHREAADPARRRGRPAAETARPDHRRHRRPPDRRGGRRPSAARSP